MDPLVVLQFDMRSSPDSPETSADRYSACLEMAKWADGQRITVLGFSEHHNTRDGFLSSPLMMAMGVASATSRVGINVSALLLPLHDPIRIAEDIAVLDLVSGGRFMATLGLGYREAEYLAMGVDWQRRGAIFDEKIATLIQAWEGQPFAHRGGQMQLNPVPVRAPGQLICIGGNSPAAARRAYAEFSASSVKALREEGKYCILTPAEAIVKTRAKGALNMAPLCGGVPIATGWDSLQLYADKVAPALG